MPSLNVYMKYVYIQMGIYVYVYVRLQLCIYYTHMCICLGEYEHVRILEYSKTQVVERPSNPAPLPPCPPLHSHCKIEFCSIEKSRCKAYFTNVICGD